MNTDPSEVSFFPPREVSCRQLWLLVFLKTNIVDFITFHHSLLLVWKCSCILYASLPASELSEVSHLVICSSMHLLIHSTKACGALVIALGLRGWESIDDGLSLEGIHMDWIPSACFLVKRCISKEIFILMWLLHKAYPSDRYWIRIVVLRLLIPGPHS